MSRKKAGYVILTVFVWLAIWKAAAIWVDNRIFLPAPELVWQSLCGLFATAEPAKSVLFSLGNIAKGFLLGVFLGGMLAVIASFFDFLQVFLSLPVRIIKATPVASFTILALFWVDSGDLSVLVSFFMVFPVIYTNTLTGMKETDSKLLEMATVFRLSIWRRLWYIYAPALLPYLNSACSVAIGLAWKSGIAAEVIGITRNSIGNHLYLSKIYLEMPEVFAWTAITVVISILTEKLVMLFLKLLERVILGVSLQEREQNGEDTFVVKKVTENAFSDPLPGTVPEKKESGQKPDTKEAGKKSEKCLTILKQIRKSYGEQVVLKDISMELCAGVPVAVMGKSGIGKTTLFRVLLGLEKQDSGEVIRTDNLRSAAVFQENRLCESFSVETNLRMVCKNRQQVLQIPELLESLGLLENRRQRVSALSGGMKRRVAIGRALLADAALVLLDEPFQGLDAETKRKVINLVREHTKGKGVLLITHDAQEAELLQCEIVCFSC